MIVERKYRMMELQLPPTPRLRRATERRVAAFDDTDTADLFEAIEAREVMERSLVRLAALRRTERDVQRLRAALQLMREAGDDRAAFGAGDFELHVALSEAAHNRLLAEKFGALHDRVRKMIDLYADTAFRSGSVATLVREHARLVEAIDRQDVDAAPRIISEMMERVRVVAATVMHMHVVQSTPRWRARHGKGERP